MHISRPIQSGRLGKGYLRAMHLAWEIYSYRVQIIEAHISQCLRLGPLAGGAVLPDDEF